jgi:hypothetical protein
LSKFMKGPPALESAARTKLASLIESRAEIAARVQEINAAEARLLAAASPDADAEAELVAIDGAASLALSEWARAGAEGDPPNSDSERREELSKRISRAQARARAVESARTALSADRNAEAQRLNALEARVEVAVAEVLFDESEPLVAEFKRLSAAGAAIAWRLTQLKSLSIEMAHSASGDTRTELFARMPKFVEKLEGIYAPASLDGHEAMAHRADWLALASRLRAGDANATLSEAAK